MTMSFSLFSTQEKSYMQRYFTTVAHKRIKPKILKRVGTISQSKFYSMKKYLCSLTAVASAICFSAFSIGKPNTTLTDIAYWYKVDHFGLVQDSYGYVGREVVMGQVSCSDWGFLDCARGYSVDPEFEINDQSGFCDLEYTIKESPF